MVISISSLTAVSYADCWKKTDSGYVYEYSDGTTAEKGWLTVDGNKYYIRADGTRKTGWGTTSNGTKYYFCKDGTAACSKQLKFSDGSRYYFDEEGKMAVDHCLKKGKKHYYYGSDGKLCHTVDGNGNYAAYSETCHNEEDVSCADKSSKKHRYDGHHYETDHK